MTDFLHVVKKMLPIVAWAWLPYGPMDGLAQGVGPVPTETPPPASSDPFDPGELGSGPFHEMEALMEVTIFRLDILTLTVRVGPETAARLEDLVEGRTYTEALADSVAAVMLEADDAWARQVFHRDVSVDRLIDGMRETAERAADAGFVSEGYVRDFADRLPTLFAFLDERGAREGDEMLIRLEGDIRRSLYRDAGGRVLMREENRDPEGRGASIPSFFAPGTRFREGLVRSLLDER